MLLMLTAQSQLLKVSAHSKVQVPPPYKPEAQVCDSTFQTAANPTASSFQDILYIRYYTDIYIYYIYYYIYVSFLQVPSNLSIASLIPGSAFRLL